MALESTQPLTETRNEYQEYFLGGKGGRCVGLIVLKSGSFNLLDTSGPVQACNGIALPFFYCIIAEKYITTKYSLTATFPLLITQVHTK